MRTVELFGSLLTLALLGPAPARAPAAAAAAAAIEPSACKATAVAARKAAERDAQDTYYNQVAMCLNLSGGVGDCLQEAGEELDEALELARDQYEARLDACGLLGPGKYDPQLSPGDFTSTVDTTYAPLNPGQTLVYEKHSPKGLEHVEVLTLDVPVDIDGFQCRVVSDIVSVDGVVAEDTLDFFAQRSNGDLWYFGEVSQSFEDGLLDNLDGSWRTGKDGAKPGVIMLSNPTPGRVYRQEFLINEAEDLARVVSLGNTVNVPAGTFHDCLETEEWSPMEPGVFERKFYAPGVGLVLVLEDGERLELVQILD
jgi:hypothetical protein